MAGGSSKYNGTTMANTLKVVGIDLASAGNIDADNKLAAKIVTSQKTYKKVILENDRPVGCIMLGDLKNFGRITKAISDQEPIADQLDDLLRT